MCSIGTREGCEGERGFCVDVLPYRMSRQYILFESHLLVLFMIFFVEGSILAQDERWRRA